MEGADEIGRVRDILPANPRALRGRVADPVDQVLERVAELPARQDVGELVLLVAVIGDNGARDRDLTADDSVGADRFQEVDVENRVNPH